MMVWQRSPPPQQGQALTGKKLTGSRGIRIAALQEFQKLKQAYLSTGQKPSLSLSKHKKIEMEWFSDTQDDERQKAHAKNWAWDVSRINDDVDDPSVPGWRALNEAISIPDPPLTTAGILPILQAPADDNDTFTTVINRFMDISNYIGQKHTIIAADQYKQRQGASMNTHI